MESRPPITPSSADVDAALRSGRERLRSAHLLLEAGQFRDTVSRAYYAALDVANALLLSKGLVARSHVAAAQLFGLHFIKPGTIERRYSRFFNRLLEAREEADYERRKDVTGEEARESVEMAEALVVAAESLLRAKGS